MRQEFLKTQGKYNLATEDICFYKIGESDWLGKVNRTDNYEMTFPQEWTPSQYNFFAKARRKYLRNGKTTDWNVRLYLSLLHRNGRNVKLLEGDFETLNVAKLSILDEIKKIHLNPTRTKRLIQIWKNNHAIPVFTLEKETKSPILIGTSYMSVSNDMKKTKEELWFNEDIPNYQRYQLFYELEISFYKSIHFYLSKTEKIFGGYCCSTERSPFLVEEVVKIVKDNNRYAWLFKDIEE